MKFFSMFSGIGGFELGIQKALQDNVLLQKCKHQEKNTRCGHNSRVGPKQTTGLGCIGFSEINKYAIQIYKRHFPNHKEYDDVSKIKWSDVENFGLLVGGFPCQSFSIAGKRRGFSDTRGTLFFEIIRCLREKQPRLLLLENVKGLLSHDKGQTFLRILTTLDELGYDLQWQVLNSKDFGVPQNRERVFIVGHLRGTGRPQVFPIGKDSKQSITRNKDFIRSWGERSGKRHFYKDNICQSISSNPNSDNLPMTGSMKIRRLTPTECERLQGFPDGWTEGVSDTQRYKCLGNAVTVNVIEAIMRRLICPIT